LFGGSSAQTEPSASESASNFFSDVGSNINSFFASVADPKTDENTPASDVGKQIGNWFTDVGNSMNEGINNMMAKATTPEEDKEQFAYVKHFGELPPTCLKPVPKRYIEQDLKNELFEDEYSEFLELKKLPCCEGFSDRFLMACLFARKLNIKRTEEMLNHNKQWREENGYQSVPALSALNKKMVVGGKFALKIPGARGKNGEGIIYVKMGNMVPSNWENFTEDCVQMTVYNGMHGGLFETMDYFRNGIMMVADMEDMGWNNVDLSVQRRMTSTLLDNFPMRTCKILLLNPPWILNAFLDGLRLFIKKKVMDRIYVLENPKELITHIDKESLLVEYGGELQYTADDWFDFLGEQEAKSSLNVGSSSSSV